MPDRKITKMSKERATELAKQLMEFIRTGKEIDINKEDHLEELSVGTIQTHTESMLAMFIGETYQRSYEYLLVQALKETIGGVIVEIMTEEEIKEH